MLTLIARVIFSFAVLCVLLFFTLGSQYLRVETSLNELNPSKIPDQNLQLATDKLTQDISHRFIMVVKGQQEEEVLSAVEQLQTQFGAISGIKTLSSNTMQSEYLNALSRFKFNLLNESQQRALGESSIDELADAAKRELYLLGSGVRVIPFEQDPLGWFSDYLIAKQSEIGISGEASDEPDSTQSNSGFYVETLAVLISQYPASMTAQQDLYQAIKDIESSLSERYQVEIMRSGMFFFAVDSAESAKGDIQRIAIGSVAGVLLLMVLVFRSLLPLTLALLSIVIGVSFAILVSTLVFGSIHVLTIVFGASLIGIVVDYSIHYFYHFLAENKTPEHHKAHTKKLMRAMLLSVITSLVGYAALGLSDLGILQKVALFSCSGLIMAWLGVIVLGPIVTRRPIVARQTFLVACIKAFQSVFARYPKVLMGIGLTLGCAGGLFLYVSKVNVNDDPRLFFHVSPSLLAQEQAVASLTQVYEPGRYIVVRGNSGEQVYATLETLYTELGANSEQVSSVLDWLPSRTTQEQNYALQQKLYMDGGVVDTFFEHLGLGDSQSSPIKKAYGDASGRYVDYPALAKQLPSLPVLWIEQNDEVFSFVLIKKNSALSKIETVSEGISNAQYVNTLGAATEALKTKRVIGVELLFVAYGLIAVMLVLYYRQLSTVFLLLIPSTASIITVSVLAAINQPITVFHIMALFLVLGLGMDYIIFAKEMRDGQGPDSKGRQQITEQAILLSALTSLLSFGLLAFSDMPIVQAFGSTILIGNSINFIAAISLFAKPQRLLEKMPNE